MTLRVLGLTKYDRAGASSRLRIMDWAEPLAAHGVALTTSPLLSDRYVARLYAREPTDYPDVARSYGRRAGALLRARAFDLVWLEKELFPWMPLLDPIGAALAGRPFAVDIDDAVFHYYDRNRRSLVRRLLGRKIDGVFRRASLVLAGNSYLADRARGAGARRVEWLPTVVPAARYRAREWTGATGPALHIGWIGSPATEAYLALVAPALGAHMAATASRLTLIGARAGRSDGLAADVRPWSVEREVEELRRFDVGIMPLPDEPFERGKCGFKLIQYMACGLPVVASPVGVNADIVEHGVTGFLATTQQEWSVALGCLSADPDLRAAMGAAGRARFEARYSRESQTPRLARLLHEAAGRA